MTFERSLALLPFVLLAACHSHAGGIHVHVEAEAPALASLTDVEGQVLDVERFELRLDTFELLFCEDPVAKIVRELFLPGVAKADHASHGSPTVLAGPIALDLAAEGRLELGMVHPPPGRYCGAMFVFGAASVEGTLDELPFARALPLAATLFLEVDEIELSSADRMARLVVHVDPDALFGDVDLAIATDAALMASLREALASAVHVQGQIVHDEH